MTDRSFAPVSRARLALLISVAACLALATLVVLATALA